MLPIENSCHKQIAVIQIYNMKALWPRLKFFESTSNFKVKVRRSKIMQPCERSCHKEYTYEISISNDLKIWSRLKFLSTQPTRKVGL